MTETVLLQLTLFLLMCVGDFLRIIIIGVVYKGRVIKEGLLKVAFLSCISSAFVLFALIDRQTVNMSYAIGRSLSMIIIYYTIKGYIKDKSIKFYFMHYGIMLLAIPAMFLIVLLSETDLLMYQIQNTIGEVISVIIILTLLAKYSELGLSKLIRLILKKYRYMRV